jgi:CRP-like cAMP-binding protein
MSIEDDIIFLEKVPTFALLGRPAVRILAIGTETKYVPGGEVLFKTGDAADCGYVIQDGSLRLKQERAGATEEITVGPGVLLGELALLIETTRPVTATAVEPSHVVRVSRSLFLKMLEGFPDAASRLRDHMATRADDTAKDFFGMRDAFDPARKR